MDRNLLLRVTFAAIDKLSKVTSAIGGSAKRASKELAGTRDAIRKLDQAQKSATAIRGLRGDLDASNERLDAQRRKIRALSQEISATDNPTKTMARNLARAEQEADRLSDKSAELVRRLDGAQTAARRMGVDVGRLAGEEARLARELGTANRRLNEQQAALARTERAQQRMQRTRELGSKLEAGGAGMIGRGVVLGTGLVFATKSAMTFEDAMADVGKVVNFKSPDQFNKMGDTILAMSKRVPIAAAGIAQIVAAAGRIGVGKDKQGNSDPAQLMQFAEDAAKMGVAFGIAADEAGETMARWRVGLSLAQPEVVGLADKVNALNNGFGGHVDQVADMVTRVGSLGRVAGVTGGQMAAMATLMNVIGVESEVGATGIKRMMLTLNAGTSATKGQVQAYKDLGLEATAMAKRMQKDAGGAILDVMQRISSLPKERQTAVLSELFGTESVAAIAPMLTALPKLAEMFKFVGDAQASAGSMNAEYVRQMLLNSTKAQLASNKFEALKIELGTKLFPIIIRLCDWFDILSNKLSALGNSTVGGWIVSLLGYLAPLLIVLGGLRIAVGWVVSAFGFLGPVFAFLLKWLGPASRAFGLLVRVFQAIAVGAGILAAALGLPVWAVIAIGVAIAALGALAYRYWDQISAAFSSGIAKLRGFVGQFGEIGRFMLEGLIAGLSPIPLIAHITSLGAQAIGALRKKLGINSPSRVFMGLGGFMTQGLAIGVERGGVDPVRRMRQLSRDMATALAIGTAAAPSLAAPGSAPGRAGLSLGTAAAAGGPRYVIHVHAGPGMDEHALARAVAEELDRRDRAAAAAHRSSYKDDD